MNRKKIFIVGSKPNVTWPDLEPDYIYAANGALARVQQFTKSKIIGVISNYVFTKLNEGAIKTFNLINNTKANKIIITPINKKHTRIALSIKDTNIIYKKYKYMSMCELMYLKISIYGIKNLLKNLFKQNIYNILKLLYNILRSCDTNSSILHISTGMLALAVALQRHKEPSDIYIIGIGFESGDGHFYDKTKLYPSAHIENDFTFYNICKNKYKKHNIYMIGG